MMKTPEEYRVKEGDWKSDKESYGNNGMFMVSFESYIFTVIASKEKNIIEYCERIIKSKTEALLSFPNSSLTKDFKKQIIHLSKVRDKILKKYNLKI